LAGGMITVQGIDEAISNLNYRNEKSAKSRLLRLVRSYYNGENSINEINKIDTERLIREIWQIPDEASDAVKRKMRNFNSIRSALNADLMRLYRDGKNPEGVVIGPSNTFVMCEEAKDRVLNEFTEQVKATGGVSLNQITDVLKIVSSTLSTEKGLLEGNSPETEKLLNSLKEAIHSISREVGLGLGPQQTEVMEKQAGKDEDAGHEKGGGVSSGLGLAAGQGAEEIDDTYEEITDEELDLVDIDEDEEEELLDVDVEGEGPEPPLNIGTEGEGSPEGADAGEGTAMGPNGGGVEEGGQGSPSKYLGGKSEGGSLLDDEGYFSGSQGNMHPGTSAEEDVTSETEDDDILTQDADIVDIEEILEEDDEPMEEQGSEPLADEGQGFDYLLEAQAKLDMEPSGQGSIETLGDAESTALYEGQCGKGSQDNLEAGETELGLGEGLGVEDLDPEDPITKARLLAEAFDGYLGAMDRYYNEYLLIQGGEYLIGSKDKYEKHHLERLVTLEPFYIGRFPVTNGLFEIFVEKTGYVTTAERVGYGVVYEGRFRETIDPITGKKMFTWQSGITRKRVEGACWYQPTGPGSHLHGKRSHPVVQVSIEDAIAFAAWTGKRLPTEAEWEAAARTRKGLPFPWGEKWREDSCNVETSRIGNTAPVDRFKKHTNELGIVDTLGNVMEWTSTTFTQKNANRKETIYYIAKGGGWVAKKETPLWTRVLLEPDHCSNILGFRCVAY